MNDTDLLAAWDEGAPPLAPRDAAFRIGVLQRLERQRYTRRLALVMTAGLASAVLVLGLSSDLLAAASAIPAPAALTLLALIILAGPAWGLARAFRIRLV